ncbi:hypothetical protein JHX96_02845 [Staphylococcus saccharolyticus]|uniref:hypothetical protein n=1 Tax=Staphylococcus saccharolyticus TaxID=33028 RepID=UPI00102D9665|nr:hypothetical protein [Staphylococcus saccharolyticus]MBL7573020.1 hypothetical protein [Staphylococcus saccharolyticus]MBL7584046.1 hypothetical protein [Staphylococcus saccharolyticus]MBL7638635.1 hypothetical protein [Staphylococcus saccharolyticus]QRJ67868.1 hypothetical protein DMB75_007635 [Staphylococcus saccharolyticus]TAA93551.1 hypothetical protein DMB74_02860 [Staphylococcus saccharolyticus]
MTKKNENNRLYAIMKHCNEFLNRQDDYRAPELKEFMNKSVPDFSRIMMDDDAFTHSTDMFKHAKESLRRKGQL